MTEFLFSYYPCHPYSRHECFGRTRLSIFLIIEECAGLPAVVWALRFLYHRYKTGSRVSAFIITLLLCDLLVLLLNPYIVTKLLTDDECFRSSMTCRILSSLWSTSIICGLHLQQVVALEAALLLRYPFHFAHVFFPSCSIIIAIIFFIAFFLFEFFSVTQFIFAALPFLLIIISTSWIVTCKIPPRISDAPYRPRKPSLSVLAFVTLTLIPYGTSISVFGIYHFIWWFSVPLVNYNLLVMGVCLMSLNVVIDPLLCVIVYRESTELNQSEVNT